KGASDVVIDVLNRIATDGSLFEGTDYYAYDRHGTQPVAVRGTIKIPVENSYSIEVNGISLDAMFKLYDRIRYRQWIISGDVLSSADGIMANIRLNREGVAKSWRTAVFARRLPSDLIEKATDMMLAEENPELLGRAYLKEARYADAAKVFQEWALRCPTDWM